MKSFLFCIAFMLFPSIVHAQEFELVTNHEYNFTDNEIQFGGIGLLAESLFSEVESGEQYDSFDRSEFTERRWALNNNDSAYVSRRAERFSSWENRRSREALKNNILERMPNMCLIVPDFDGGLLSGCLYHFNPRPRYVRFE